MPGFLPPGQGPDYFPPRGRKIVVKKVTYPNNHPLNPRANTPSFPSPTSTLTGGGITTDARGRQASLGFDPSNPEAVRRVQKFLQGKGYHIKVDGKWGSLTKGAFDNFTVKPGEQRGSRNSELWNAKNGLASVPDRNYPKTNYPPTQYPPTNIAADPPADPKGGNGYSFDPSQFNPNTGAPIGPLRGGAQLFNVNKGAHDLAGLEFDPQIHDQMVAQSHVAPDLAQHLADIGNWYGQVQKALGTAKGRNEAMFNNEAGASGAATRDVLSSLGGNANLAAGVVGQAGADNANELAQMGSAESSYQNDLAPILAAEGAGAKTREQARQSQVANESMNQIASLRGQEGQSEGAHRLDLQGQNNTILDNRQNNTLARLKYNNDLAQTHFGNSLSVAQTAAAAAMTGAQVNNINATTKRQYGGFTGWANLDPATRDKLIQQAVANSLDPKTLGLAKGVTPLQAWQRGRQYLIGQGYTSAHATGGGPMAGNIPDPRAHAMIENMLGAAIAAAKTRAANAGGTV